MTYDNIVTGTFLKRPNRFIAYVDVNGDIKTCHVKNTGRCQELLVPGCRVVLEFHPKAKEMKRKTEYDLIAVYKGDLLINMDSQAPNQAALEWMREKEAKGLSLENVGIPTNVQREVTHGDSRFDLAFELKNEVTGKTVPAFMEVKGVTLEKEGNVFFPDAPTIRGVKHLNGLVQAKKDGFETFLLLVIQMKGIRKFYPNDETHKAFGDALRAAAAAGVHILAYDCVVQEDSMSIDEKVEVGLLYTADPIAAHAAHEQQPGLSYNDLHII